jgi:Family of unknown function (DUF6261)
MELVSFATSSLHNLESGQFIVRYFSDFRGTGLNPATDPEFEIIHNDLAAQSATFNLALAQIIAQQETEQLLNLDQKRDKKVAALRSAWNAYRSEDDGTPKKNAYNKLKTLMNNYKDIATQNYEAESLGLDNFIHSLRSADNLPALQLLNMVEHTDNLEIANRAFKTVFDNRSNTAVSTISYDTKVLKKNILKTYKELSNYVWTMANRRSGGNQFYITTLDAINNGRTYYANLIAHRASNPAVAPPAV